MVFSRAQSFCNTEDTYTSRVPWLRFINKQQHSRCWLGPLKVYFQEKKILESKIMCSLITLQWSQRFFVSVVLFASRLSHTEKNQAGREILKKPLEPGYDHVRMSDKPENRR